MFLKLTGAAALTAILFSGAATAGTVIVLYTGSYDENGNAPGDDYDGIGGLPDVGLFNLLAGTNKFHGSIYTPDDSADVFLIGVGQYQTLDSVTVTFGTNLSPFNPLFAAPPPTFNLSATMGVDEVVNSPVGTDGQTAFSSFTGMFTRGQGTYAITFGNGTFAPNNGGGVDYTISFGVTETLPPPPPSAIPVGPALPLLASGLGSLLVLRRRNH